ncbi:MAG: D-tyrosyl-tRNA(Tyr) deacylase, partial [Hydrogenovibrio crunogenus]|nr:D-tyrosyl-tRNA(Tyr) deacylase [Hydrogenovibrio crunogenus]
MICLLQRVTHGSVSVSNETIGQISSGLVVLCGFQPHDTTESLEKMAHKLLHYRVFSDEDDKMNLNLQLAFSGKGGDLLLVPQFTLAADTKKGLRPSFHTSASPDLAHNLFNEFVALITLKFGPPQTGKFGANMQVRLIN